MYCENCGHKLSNNDLFCEECGTKTNKDVVLNQNNSNKTIWIIIGCVFGGLFLLFSLCLLFVVLAFNTEDFNSITYQEEIDEIIDEYEDDFIDSF